VSRVASDAVDTARATVARHGGPRSRRLRLPELDVDDGAVVRVTVDGRGGFARVDRDADGLFLAGAHPNRRQAREGDGENLLTPFLGPLDPGSSVHVDVVDPGHHYGLRHPGERVVYETPERRDGSLADIAENLG